MAQGRRRVSSWVLLAILAVVLVGWFALNLLSARTA